MINLQCNTNKLCRQTRKLRKVQVEQLPGNSLIMAEQSDLVILSSDSEEELTNYVAEIECEEIFESGGNHRAPTNRVTPEASYNANRSENRNIVEVENSTLVTDEESSTEDIQIIGINEATSNRSSNFYSLHQSSNISKDFPIFGVYSNLLNFISNIVNPSSTLSGNSTVHAPLELTQTEKEKAAKFTCPICLDDWDNIMSRVTSHVPCLPNIKTPIVITRCGHHLCLSCAGNLVQRKQRCPKCRKTLSKRDFINFYA
ncbi:zinc C3HC4 type domain-containing protein [Cryptosporidium andersoni]|uniref:Zinc C3HC4 type domain-containing protein n=1 Tax=Cryptosporidium andersoni TaxID=117008 RepID=A0A1J4MUY8_9CRYT|nr:zinc C3HC4 type domain-containing protein [Cryptosporidium andersoni]